MAPTSQARQMATENIDGQKPIERLYLKHFDVQLNALADLLDTSELSDFTIKGATREWKAHSFVFRHSQYFRGALDGGFQEAESRIIDMSSEDETILDLVIKIMYQGSVTPVDDHESVPTMIGALYAMATRLDLSTVAALAVHNYDTVMQDMQLSNCSVWTPFLPRMLELAYEYTTEDDGTLRDPLVARMHQLLLKADAAQAKELRAKFEEVFAAYPAFAFDIATHMHEQVLRW